MENNRKGKRGGKSCWTQRKRKRQGPKPKMQNEVWTPIAAIRTLFPHLTTEKKVKTEVLGDNSDPLCSDKLSLDFSSYIVPLRTRRQHKEVLTDGTPTVQEAPREAVNSDDDTSGESLEFKGMHLAVRNHCVHLHI